MTLRLHWSPDSANIVVRMALEELGLDYQGARVDRAAKAHRQPEYLKLNPQGLIPVLEDGDLVLFETGAILMHLADRTGRLGAEGPDAQDPQARSAFLKWLFFVSNTLHAECRMAFYSHRYLGDPEAVGNLRAGLARRFREHLALLEGELARTGWLVADRPTLVESYLAACLRWIRVYPSDAPLLANVDLPSGVTALLTALEARPAVQRAFAAEHITGAPLTAPERPDLPPEQVSG